MSENKVIYEDLPDGKRREIYPNGREVVRDDQGRIVGHVLPPDLARQQHTIKQRNEERRGETVDDLLAELGLDSVSARLLAELVVKGGGGAVGAARELFRMSGRDNVEVAPAEHEVRVYGDKGQFAVIDGVAYSRVPEESLLPLLEVLQRKAAGG